MEGLGGEGGLLDRGRLLQRAVYDLIQTLDRRGGVYKTSAWRLFERVN